MTTSGDMLTDSFQKIGVFAPGETPDSASMATGLKVLNDMLDSWSNESLACFAIAEQSIALVANKPSYTVGVGGDVSATRPIRLIYGTGAAYLLDSNFNRYPVDVIPRDQWNTIWNLQRSTSNLPDTIFYDPQFPFGILNVYPLYNGAIPVTLFWNSYLQLNDFPDLVTDVSLPPGYVKAIQDNLAIELVPYFKGDNYQVPPLLLKIASDSKGNVKRSNMRENVAVFEKELRRAGSGVYNVYSDTAR